jgi:heme-degrading monooxygenase HmoA
VFARIHTLETTPEQHDEGLEVVRDHLLPWARESTGFRGLISLTDQARSTTLVVTFWADEESLRASEEPGDKLSALAATTVGAKRRSLEDFEVTLFELGPST